MQADLAVDAVGEADTPDIALACLHSLRRGGILVLDGSMKCPLPVPYGTLPASIAGLWQDCRHHAPCSSCAIGSASQFPRPGTVACAVGARHAGLCLGFPLQCARGAAAPHSVGRLRA